MSSKFTCRFCKDQFDVPKGLYKHLQSVHNAGISRDNRTCPICGVLCLKYEGYRDHLLYIHGQTDEGMKLSFKSLNEFLVWKAELELKHNCKYVLQSTPKVLPSKEKKYYYQCDRSDSKDKKDKKSLSVVMKTCTSVISVVESFTGFKVEYWDTHSGHSKTSTIHSLQNELEAAVSSVEMVNALADSDDSFDRSEVLASGSTNPSISKVEKQSYIRKTNTPASVHNFNNSFFDKKRDNTKSSENNDNSNKKSKVILYSLASVACGKGITKKAIPKKKENNGALKTGLELSSESYTDQANESLSSIPEVPKGDSALNTTPPCEVLLKNQPVSISTTTTTLCTTLPTVTKTASFGLPAIAPKITCSATTTITTSTPSYTSINSLIGSNNAFPNQYVIVNPLGMDQNTLNSKQNILAAGQNIVFSLGSPGQNIVPIAPQPMNTISISRDNNAMPNTKVTKNDSSKKINTSDILTSISTATQNDASKISTSTVSSIASSTAPITLTTGLNNAPVILSSLPIGSTFMSVNNSLIPIATPSGTFLPTSLPPNIVLTPVMPGTSVPNMDSSHKNTFNSVTSSKTTTVPNILSQTRYTPSSTVAITVSSIVKEPVYTSSTIKQMSNIIASLPVSSASSIKTYSKSLIQNSPVPITISGRISPIKSINRLMTSTPIKNKNLSKAGESEVHSAIKRNISNLDTELGDNMLIDTTKSPISSIVLPTVSCGSSPKIRMSARKRITTPKSKLNKNSPNNLSSIPLSSSCTKVVNSQLNLAPISSTTAMPQQMDVHKAGTLLFESSGDVYMLEPVENDVPSLKSMSNLDISKAKIERSAQTIESSLSTKPKLQRKRAAAVNEDSTVMLKVKCYQLEMKYLNMLTECKQLKIELTKERLKNSELMGEKTVENMDEDITPDTTRNKAAEILKEIEENLEEKSDANIYTMTKTSVLRGLYEDLEDLCNENNELSKELENYRAHDKFYRSLKKKIYDEEF